MTANPSTVRTQAEALRNTHDWFEWNSGWAPPDPDTLADWLADGICRCPDDCLVAPETWCEHGLASWDVILRTIDDSITPAGRPTRVPPVKISPERDPADSPEPDPFRIEVDASNGAAANEADRPEMTDKSGHRLVPPDVEPTITDVVAPHVPVHVPPPHELTVVDRFDQAVDRAFDRLRGTEPADRIFYAVTELADFSLLWLLIGTSKAVVSDKQLPNAIRVGAVLSAESLLVNGAIKSVFRRERPVAQEARPYKLRVPLTTSFPSGHSSAAAVAALLLSEHSRVKPLYWGLAGLVATSRIYVRIHHASDVVGGVALGMVLGTVAKKAWPLDKGPVGTRRIRRRFRNAR